MATLKDIVAYFCKYYPHKGELSKARLTKMVYLADWKSAIEREKQLTNIDWVYNFYGPYVDDVAQVAASDAAFQIQSTTNMFGGYKEVVSLKNGKFDPKVTNKETEILDFIIEKTSSLYWNDFISLVYSTYPIIKSKKLSHLDLVELAKEYKEVA